jgi:succinate-semialdehyde dehydrogenase/glutarate-semialdehyde dehydrogenase
MINDVLTAYGMPETPWGGVKQSAVGFTHSDDGLRSMCQQRHVNVDRLALRRELWWYPYTEKSYRFLLRGMKLLFRARRDA